jgi:hypothetical protein
MKSSFVIFCLLLLIISKHSFAQNALSSNKKMFLLDSLKAPCNLLFNMRDFQWLVGKWKTELDNGSYREDKIQKLDNGKLAGLKRIKSDRNLENINFVELWQDGNSIKMSYKDIRTNLPVEGSKYFKLLFIDGDYFYFTGLTIHKVNNDLYESLFDNGNGKLQITKRMN